MTADSTLLQVSNEQNKTNKINCKQQQQQQQQLQQEGYIKESPMLSKDDHKSVKIRSRFIFKGLFTSFMYYKAVVHIHLMAFFCYHLP